MFADRKQNVVKHDGVNYSTSSLVLQKDYFPHEATVTRSCRVSEILLKSHFVKVLNHSMGHIESFIGSLILMLGFAHPNEMWKILYVVFINVRHSCLAACVFDGELSYVAVCDLYSVSK